MARIREALWKVDATPNPGAAAAPVTCPASPMNEPQPEENDVPFIEVGGPHKLVEGSPSVMTVVPVSVPVKKMAAPQDQEAKAELPAGIPIERPKPVTTASVIFRPLSGPEPALAPALERFAQELVAFHRADDPLSEQYRVLARDLAAQVAQGKPQVLLIAPATGRNEPAALVLNLAITRARQGTVSVVVIDANLYQPKTAQLLGLPQAPGLRDVLCGATSLQRAVQETGLAGLYVLTAGKPPEDGRGLIAGEAMRAVLRHLRTRFGWILITAPFWDGRPELVALGSACDAAYLVLSEAEAAEPAVQELIQLIPGQGIALRGCIYAGQ